MKIFNVNTEEGRNYLQTIKNRRYQLEDSVIKAVDTILQNVRNRGDEALIEYTQKFDSPYVTEGTLKVTRSEIDEAYTLITGVFIEAIHEAKANIQAFHERQKENSWMMTKKNGAILGQQIRALEKVGIYVPGGTAAYPSTVLMNAIPAMAAGVEQIVMVTPPLEDGKINPYILVTADLLGIQEIYKIGGAQAIGALAYGTDSVPKVDKIVGPGNIYVAMAKRSVYGIVDIDMIAGPSEILIIADDQANARYIAADLMSQAEHDRLASSILVTTSTEIAKEVVEQLELQIQALERKEIIQVSLESFGALIIAENLEQSIDIANQLAPEHLEILIKDPFSILSEIKNAGSVFLGEYSPEPLGDYMAGPNHTLPTSGTARFFSPLSVSDFLKKSSFIYYKKEALENVADKIITIAEVEGLTAHANSIKVRFDK